MLTPRPALAKKKGQAFEGRTHVVEVQVPVNVIDRARQPVRGLTAEDFKVFDQGRPREIVAFATVDLELWQPERLRSDPEQLPAVARRHFLLLFDLSFSRPASIVRAQRAAREFVLEALHPTDLVAVATYTLENGPRLVITFTPDRAQLAHAIDTLGARRRGLPVEDPLHFVLVPPKALGDLAGLPTRSSTGSRAEEARLETSRLWVKQMAKSERTVEAASITAFSRSLADLARVLDSIRGRKQVVLFSEGFDSRLFLGRRPDTLDTDQKLSRLEAARGELWMVDSNELYGFTGLQNDLEEMLEAFRRADCTIQAVDAGGLRADFVAQDARSSGQEALFYLANGTGGELFEDANDLGEQLLRVLERTSVTYVLTFRADDVAFDASYHRLKVTASLPRGTRLSHRKGYFAPRPFGELDPLEKSLLAADAIASAARRTDIDIALLLAPFRAGSAAYVPVIIEIGGQSLLEGEEEREVRAEIYAYVTDERGEMKDFFTQLVTINSKIGRESLMRSGLKYYCHFSLPPGEYRARVLVRNASTGRTGVETARLRVPHYTETEPTLLPPFFLEPPGTWVLVRERDVGGPSQSVVYPFTVNGDPFVPAARLSLGARDEAQLCLIAYNLDGGKLILQTRISKADGTAVDGGHIDLLERTVTGITGLDKLRAAFRPTGLARGEYTLEVAVGSSDQKWTQSNSIPFTVRD
jgi:VWFA-related protein